MTSDPISCDESLAALRSAPASELVRDTPVARHLSDCPDCSRVAEVVLERERSLGIALDSLSPRADPVLVADRAAIAAERRGTARFFTWMLVAAMAVTAWFFLDDTLGTRERSAAAANRVETIRFECLTPAQAEGLIEPYVRSNGHGIYTPPEGIRGITIRAQPTEIGKARQLITEFDAQMRSEKKGACTVAPPTPAPKP